MKVLGIIPARYASSRLPGKPLVDIEGQSLIQRVYERAGSVIDTVIVATDDERIKDHVNSFGGEVVMTGTHHKTGTNRCLEAYEKYGHKADIIVNIQGDEPLLEVDHIKDILKCFEGDNVRMASLVLKVNGGVLLKSGEGVYVTMNYHQDALYFSRSVIPFVRDSSPEKWTYDHTFYKHIGMYAFTPDALLEFANLPESDLEAAESLEQNRWLQHGNKIRLGISNKEVIAVDTPSDLEAVREIIKQQKNQ